MICLALADQGGLWLGTQDGLRHLEPDTATQRLVWRPGLPTDLPHAHDIQRLWIANDGRLWLAGEHAVFHRAADRWETLPLPAGAGDLRCRRLTGDAAGNLWVVRGGQLFRVATNGVRPWSGPATLADAYITDVLPDAGGGLWVTTRYAGLHRLTTLGLRMLTTQDGLPHNSVTSVTPERGDGVWVGTLRGVARWRDGRFETPAAELPLAEIGARAVFEERSGDLWIGRTTELGPQLAWLEAQTNGYRSLGVESGIRGPGLFAEDQSGRLWMGGAEGLACLLTNYLPRVFPQGGQLGVHLHRKRASRWQIVPNETSHIAGPYWDMFQPDRWRPGPKDDTPWQPLASVPAERIRDAPFPVDFRPANFQFRAFAETRDGAIWLGTWGGGLHRLHDGKITVLTKRDGLPSDHLHCLHEDTDGLLWLGTTRGLTRLSVRSSRGNEALPNSEFRVYPVHLHFRPRSSQRRHPPNPRRRRQLLDRLRARPLSRRPLGVERGCHWKSHAGRVPALRRGRRPHRRRNRHGCPARRVPHTRWPPLVRHPAGPGPD